MHKNELGKIKNHSLIICERPLVNDFDHFFISILAYKIWLLYLYMKMMYYYVTFVTFEARKAVFVGIFVSRLYFPRV